MKILHTSDWHIGHSLYGYDRTDEHRAMLAQIADILVAEAPDALIVSGDIYDTAIPSAASQRVLVEGLVELHRLTPDVRIILTTGNHDSAARHDAEAALWGMAGIDIISVADDDYARNIIELPGSGYIAAVPYVNSRFLPEGYFQGITDAIAERNTGGLPVVMMAHLAVAGGDFTGHDSDETGTIIGNIDSCPLASLGNGYDYLALGHIHKPQQLSAAARYCGSPLPAGFDETYSHSVSIVEISGHGATPEISAIEISSPMPLVNIPAHGAASWPEAMALLAELPSDKACYVRLNVADDGSAPTDCRQAACNACQGKAARFCLVNIVREKSAAVATHAASQLSVEDFRSLSPIDVARMHAERSGRPFTDEMLAMLATAIINVEEANRQK